MVQADLNLNPKLATEWTNGAQNGALEFLRSVGVEMEQCLAGQLGVSHGVTHANTLDARTARTPFMGALHRST